MEKEKEQTYRSSDNPNQSIPRSNTSIKREIAPRFRMSPIRLKNTKVNKTIFFFFQLKNLGKKEKMKENVRPH